MTSILIFGHDALLLETRSRLLEQTGYQVCRVANFDDLERILAAGQIDLLVLCHSLSMEECERSIALTFAWPQMKSLILTAGPKGYADQITGAVLDAMDGPAKLLSTVGKLVESESKAHTHIY